MTGTDIERSSWPPDRAHRRLLEHLHQVRAENGGKSLRRIGEAMPLAHSRVSVILAGAPPTDERQVELLVRAMGGGEDEAVEAVRLFQAAVPPKTAASRPAGADRVDEMIAAAWSTHWVPSATGGGPSGPGSGFCGRSAAMQHLAAWLAAPEDRRPRVVTGDPGSGKSAVLARTLLDVSEDGHLSVVAAVHARGRTLVEVVAIIARQYGLAARCPEELVRLLGARPAPSLLVIDAVDESDEAEVLLTGLLRPLARQALDSEVGLLVGTRRHVTRRIGTRWVELVDLDGAAYADFGALADYVRDILSSQEGSPYAAIPDRTGRVAHAVATRADGSFLIGRLVAMALALRLAPATDLDEFPDSVIAAMETYLDALPGDRRWVEELLRPLAFAEGAGLPRGLWLRLACELCGLPGKYRLENLDELFDGAVASLLTVSREVEGDGDHTVYRLFHDALADALADVRSADPEAPADPGACQLAISRSLRESACASGDRPDWSGADPYVRRHLATHAAGTPMLSALVQDPAFLLDADVDRLLSALASGVDGANAARARATYELVADRLVQAGRAERAAYLALSGLQEGTTDIVAGLEDMAGSAPWWPVRTAWETRALHRTLYRHDDVVNAVAVTSLDSEPMVVSGGDDCRVRIRSLTGRGGDEGVVELGTPVMCLAAVVLDGLPAVVAGGEDGDIYVLDVPTLQLLARSLREHPGAVNALLPVVEEDGSTTLVSGDMGGELCRWSVVPCEPLGAAVSAGPGEISGLCRVGGRLLSCGAPNRVQFFDDRLNPGAVLFEGHPAATAVIPLDAGSRDLVVSGHSDGSLRTFDPVGEELVSMIPTVQGSYLSVLEVSGSRVVCGGEAGTLTILDPTSPNGGRIELHGHNQPVLALTAASLGDRHLVISAGEDATVRQWDLGVGADDLPRHQHDRSVTGLVRTGRRELAVQSTERSIRLRDLTDWAEIGRAVTVDPSATLMTTFAISSQETGLLVATGDSDGRVSVENIDRGETVARYTGHDGWVADTEFAALDGDTVLVTVGHDDVLRVAALGGGPAVPPINLPDVRGTVAALALSSVDGRLVATVATTGGQVQVWDVRDGRLVAEMQLDGAGTISVLVTDGRFIFGGTLTGWTFTLSIGDAAPVCHHTHPDSVSAVATGRLHGRSVVVSGSEHGDVVVRRVDGTPGASFGLDARVHALLLADDGHATIATSRGVAVLRLPSFR